ncbi:alpha/beta fold hydrolase [Brevibacillus daliensis]|uniref:alpha/beta fold hydrolase n=1 Tax=Brevibacillus daliensis TaxID=2892995 RepID=UPI001E3CB770|nr:alpha/beta hydrolase [Brevibacillus daliensis]
MGYYITVEPNVNLFVEDVDPGNGKPIVFLHGWPVNHKMYEYQFDQLPKMGFRCIGIDLRGHGNSDKPWTGYTYDRMADDVRVVIDSLRLKNIVLAGHSMGGAISIRYMARHAGHQVAKLALFGAAAPVFTRRPDFPYGFTKEEVNKLIEETYADRPQMLVGFGDIFFYRYLTESFKDWFHGLGMEASGHATAMCAIALRDEDLRPDLPKINVPTGIFHGIHDKVCPFAFAEAMNTGIKNSELIPFWDSGHGLFYCEKEKFNEALIHFIKE